MVDSEDVRGDGSVIIKRKFVPKFSGIPGGEVKGDITVRTGGRSGGGDTIATVTPGGTAETPQQLVSRRAAEEAAIFEQAAAAEMAGKGEIPRGFSSGLMSVEPNISTEFGPGFVDSQGRVQLQTNISLQGGGVGAGGPRGFVVTEGVSIPPPQSRQPDLLFTQVSQEDISRVNRTRLQQAADSRKFQELSFLNLGGLAVTRSTLLGSPITAPITIIGGGIFAATKLPQLIGRGLEFTATTKEQRQQIADLNLREVTFKAIREQTEAQRPFLGVGQLQLRGLDVNLFFGRNMADFDKSVNRQLDLLGISGEDRRQAQLSTRTIRRGLAVGETIPDILLAEAGGEFLGRIATRRLFAGLATEGLQVTGSPVGTLFRRTLPRFIVPGFAEGSISATVQRSARGEPFDPYATLIGGGAGALIAPLPGAAIAATSATRRPLSNVLRTVFSIADFGEFPGDVAVSAGERAVSRATGRPFTQPTVFQRGTGKDSIFMFGLTEGGKSGRRIPAPIFSGSPALATTPATPQQPVPGFESSFPSISMPLQAASVNVPTSQTLYGFNTGIRTLTPTINPGLTATINPTIEPIITPGTTPTQGITQNPTTTEQTIRQTSQFNENLNFITAFNIPVTNPIPRFPPPFPFLLPIGEGDGGATSTRRARRYVNELIYGQELLGDLLGFGVTRQSATGRKLVARRSKKRRRR